MNKIRAIIVLVFMAVTVQAETNTDQSTVDKLLGKWSLSGMSKNYYPGSSAFLYNMELVAIKDSELDGYIAVDQYENMQCSYKTSQLSLPYHYLCIKSMSSMFDEITDYFVFNLVSGKLSGKYYSHSKSTALGAFKFGYYESPSIENAIALDYLTEFVSYEGARPIAWYFESNVLIIEDVNVDGARYWVKLENQGNYKFSVKDSKLLSSTSENYADYDTANGIVTIPKLVVSDEIFKVILELLPDGLFGVKEVNP